MPQYLRFGTVIVDIVLNVHHIAKAELPWLEMLPYPNVDQSLELVIGQNGKHPLSH